MHCMTNDTGMLLVRNNYPVRDSVLYLFLYRYNSTAVCCVRVSWYHSSKLNEGCQKTSSCARDRLKAPVDLPRLCVGVVQCRACVFVFRWQGGG